MLFKKEKKEEAIEAQAEPQAQYVAQDDTRKEAPMPAKAIVVEYADLRDATLIRGVGTESSLNRSRLPDLTMELGATVLFCRAKGIAFGVPLSNVKSMVLAK